MMAEVRVHLGVLKSKVMTCIWYAYPLVKYDSLEKHQNTWILDFVINVITFCELYG